MAEEFSPQGITFVFVYTREAHPGDRYPCHTRMEQKLAHARDMVSRWQIRRPMLVDDLEGTVHRAYGTLPNMTYIVNAGGSTLYRASWTDPRSIHVALEQIVYERGQRRAGARMTLYYMEWLPQRVNDRLEFMESLFRDVGPRAVEEFIAAVAHNGGGAAARPLQDWWAERRAEVEAGTD